MKIMKLREKYMGHGNSGEKERKDGETGGIARDDRSEMGQKKLLPVSFFELFRFSSRKEKVLLTIGAASAMAHGSLLPTFTIVRASVSSVCAYVS